MLRTARRTSVLLLVVFMLSTIALAGEHPEASPGFVDLDGDGFSDEALDADNNGIPDEIESDTTETAPLERTGGIFSGMPVAEIEVAPVETNSEAFGRLRFAVRALCCDRSGLDCGFEEGGSAGSSGSSGGACPGGVCLR